MIVTHNIKDFPQSELSAWNVESTHPDDFIQAQIDLDGPRVFAAVQQIADSWRNPPGTVSDVLDQLERNGITEAVASLRAM